MLAVGASVAVAAASAAPALVAGKATRGATARALTVESSPVGQANGFNPFVPTSASSIVGATSLIYEPLFQSNILKPGKYYPFLATQYKWGTGGKTITFTIRQGVKWSDGLPFSAADVAVHLQHDQEQSLDQQRRPHHLQRVDLWQHGDAELPVGAVRELPEHRGHGVHRAAASVWQQAGRSVHVRRHEPDRHRPRTPCQSVGASGLVLTANTQLLGRPGTSVAAPRP